MQDAWSDTEIAALFREHYRMEIDGVELLNLGADAVSRVYRVTAVHDPRQYFLKARPYSVFLPGVEIPSYLSRLGIPHILSPIPAKDGRAVIKYQDDALILYPFLTGGNAMEKGLTLRQWIDLGSTLQAVHSTVLPEQHTRLLPREQFLSGHRRLAENFIHRILAGELDDGPGAAVADGLRTHRNEIGHLIRRAETLGQKLSLRKNIPLVVCHADLHKWNLFVTTDNDLYVIDWDSLKLAPRECDLMYIGGNIGGDKKDENEVTGFYGGYSGSQADPEIIAYYRFERIAEDIAEFGKQVWNGPAPSLAECEKIASWLNSNFDPGCEYETACQSDIK